MKKITYPPFLTLIATILATFANKVFGIHVDIEMAAGALAVAGNYILVQFAVDIKKIKNGQIPTGSFNSVKLYTTLVVCVALGISNYFKLDFSPELIVTWVGFAITIITGKAVKDMLQSPKGGKTNEEHYGDHGPAI